MARLNQLDAISLADLDGTNGFRLDGIDAGDGSGRSVAGAGDVNGDGIADLIVGATGANRAAGESYVVFGSVTGFAASLDLSELDGSNGFRLGGIDAYDVSGISVAGAGDVNGDGIGDLIVGALGADYGAGESYVVFGTETDFAASLDLSALDGSNGFRLDGIGGGDSSGASVAGTGDVNGDGIGDLIVGAPAASPTNLGAGESYVVFGTDTDFAASFDLSALDGSNGFRLEGIDAYDGSGGSVAGAGDINGDGIDDLIIGAADGDPDGQYDAGEIYVVFGTDTGFAASLDLAALDGSDGFRLDGIDFFDFSGVSVAGAGDVNGDGIGDLIVGTYGADSDGKLRAGESYVVFGSDTGFAASLDLSELDGSNGFRLGGIDAYDISGISVAGAGDVNGDGLDDLIIGAFGANPGGKSRAGESYVVFGKDTGFASSLDLSALDGSNGFRLDGIDAYDFSGASVAGAGDINGDGFDDLIIGAPFADPGDRDNAGESYVVFGFPSVLFTQQADVRDLNRFDLAEFANTTRALGGNDTVVLSETQNLGVAFFGGTGDDSITGSRRADDIRGGTGDDELRGRTGGDALAGGSGNDALAGGIGDDTLVGGLGRDTLAGGRGDDALAGGGGGDRLFGGRGRDTLAGGWGDDTLVGGTGADTLVGGLGDDRFDFNGTTDSTVGGRDLIRRFDKIGRAAGDRIDLLDIDARAGGPDTAFDFIGTAGFSARGQLRVFNQNGNTVIAGNTTGDLDSDFRIVVDDGIAAASAWREADFLL